MNGTDSQTTGTRGRVTPDEVQFLAAFLREGWSDAPPPGPTAWAPDEGGGEGGSGGDDGGDAGASDGGDSGDDGGDADDGDGDDGGEAHDGPTAAELAAIKRRLEESEKARKKAERDLKRRNDQERAEAGEYKEMYEESQREVAALTQKLRDGAFDRTVAKAAAAAKFRNPSIAVSLLPQELREQAVDEDGEVDEKLVERELAKLAKRESYLVLQEKPQREVTPDRDGRTPSDARDDGSFNPRARLRRAYEGTAQGG